KIGPEPVQIYDNLWAQEVDARYSMEKYWGRFQDYMVTLFTQRGIEEIVAEEVTLLPGLEEGAHLLWINKFVEDGTFDVLVVDAAPTAETLRLLSLPDATRWWFEKLIALTKGATGRILRPLSKLAMGTDLPDNDAWAAVKLLFDTLDKVRDLLADPSMSSIRLVINAEKMVIKETQRTYTYLNLYGYPTDAVICNRIYPDSITDPYFAAWKDAQAQNLALIGEAFGELPLLKAPLFDREMGGLERLRELAQALYGEQNPSDVLFAGKTHTIDSDGGDGYYLRVPLPFADKSDMDVFRSADELTLRVGPYRRNIVLPYALHNLEIGDARFDEAVLRIHFTNKRANHRR
ncbi:MAG: TRC40/GET3/ArsA family transport-energizing ATPase, partial [Anaerolineae bacterium]|nr:TRC40/GET3/ArsA family transport-energizing ATPase [Anaerolineae bacterium]